MQIGELFVKLGILPDDKKAKEFFNLLDKGKQSMLGMGAMAAGTALTLDNMFRQSITTAFGLTEFAAQTDLSTTALQRWQFVAASTGVKAEDMTGSVEGLQRALSEIRLGGGNVAPFQMLGVNPASPDAFSVLSQLRANMAMNLRRYSAMEVTGLIQQMGLSPNMMAMLRMNDKDFKTLYGMARIVGPEQIRSVEKFNYALGITGQLIKATFFDMFARVAASPAFDYITKLGGGLAQLIDGTIGWTNALMALVLWLNRTAIGMALVWLAKNPWLAAGLVAGVAGYDLYRMSQGKSSITGSIINFITNPGSEKGQGVNQTLQTQINVHTTADEKGTADKVADNQLEVARAVYQYSRP